MKNCPQCGKEMKVEVLNCYAYIDWDDDDDIMYKVEEYFCKDCNIECRVNYICPWNPTEEWVVPMEMQVTLKQSKAIKAINSVLHLGLEPHTKKEAWKMINEHMEHSKEQAKIDFSEFCEDNADWLPEYY